MQQLQLFPETIEDKCERKLKIMEDKYERLRKSQHARISGLQKKIDDLESQIELITSNICKGSLF